MRCRAADDLEAGGDDVQPFAAILADLHHVGAATGASHTCRLDQLFDARQMIWQMAKIALGCRPSGCAIRILRGYGITDGFRFGDSGLKVFECQLAVVRVQLF